jgi:molybdopterin-guanine dinucleotide biosynthesis protein MobB
LFDNVNFLMFNFAVPRPALHADAIRQFRERACEASLGLFAERGYDGFPLRALGEALGCSPATPYTYFRDKADIFAAVRARAFETFCDDLEAARPGDGDAWSEFVSIARAYVHFARSRPHAYRVMFHLEPPGDPLEPSAARDYARPVSRSWTLLRSTVARGVEQGAIRGDPSRVAVSFWSSLHGVMALELADRLEPGIPADDVVAEILQAFEAAYRVPEPPRRPPIVAIAAPSGSGKTTLIEALIRKLGERGLRVGAIKSDAHRVELDRPGKDTHRMRSGGAEVTALLARNQVAVFQDAPGRETRLDEIVDLFFPHLDLVLAEGFRSRDLPTIVVRRQGVEARAWQWPSDVIAVATDAGGETPAERLDLNDVDAIADFVCDRFTPKLTSE